ncbi:HK97-gp10 family putative phage morphogenesis protein [Sporolactobacillus shoreae]|nr:HK97-gp10 family putative phage morphogenesis protein [Sporolactobacillus shoreae]
MSVTFEDSGIEQALLDFAHQNSNVERKVVRSEGALIAEALEKNTPWEDESKYRSWNEQFKLETEKGKEHKAFKHLKEDVVIQMGQDDKVTIGYGKDTYWRAHFVENGTARTGGMVDRSKKRHWGKGIQGQHFMQRTIDEEQAIALNRVAASLKAALKL